MSSPFQRFLRILRNPIVVIVVVLVSGCLIAWAWPKAAVDEPSGSIAHYRGFRFVRATSLFGPRYYRLRRNANDGADVGWYDTTVEFTRAGYNPFEARYPNGVLAAKGTCNVAQDNPESLPLFDPKDIREAEFYKPDVTLAANVTQGTGTQMRFQPDGTKSWEIELKDYKWIRYRQWHPNGQLGVDCPLRDGKEDGIEVGFWEDGKKDFERTHVAGKLTGASKRYDSHGVINTIEYYDPPGHLRKTEHYDENGKLSRTEKP
jgi:antitoxin component YwqK of YwqJK toxin-antitoxin module